MLKVRVARRNNTCSGFELRANRSAPILEKIKEANFHSINRDDIFMECFV